MTNKIGKGYVFDTETTGVGDDDQVIEAAWIRLEMKYFACPPFGYATPNEPYLSRYAQRFCNKKPISYGAMATHHIIEDDLKDCPDVSEFKLPEDAEYLIGHKIEFDWQKIGSPSHLKLIDTLSLSRYFWQDDDSHSLSACIYRFLPPRLARELTFKSAHNALNDVKLCLMVLRHICYCWNINSLPMLYELSEKSKIPKIITFGKYKGQEIKDIPHDYINWYQRQQDTDPYLIKAMNGEGGITDKEIAIMLKEGWIRNHLTPYYIHQPYGDNLEPY